MTGSIPAMPSSPLPGRPGRDLQFSSGEVIEREEVADEENVAREAATVSN